MLVRKQPLVKLLDLEKQTAPGRGRPYTYCERTIFLYLFLKTVKSLDACSAFYHYLSHEVKAHIRLLVGLAPHQPRFEQRAR